MTLRHLNATLLLAATAGLLVLAAGCGNDKEPQKSLIAVLETDKGTIRIKLLSEIAPQTVNSFVSLAREGYFDGVTFHRVLPGFVAQGGDPTGTGTGGPGYNLPDEFSDRPIDRGTVAMANTGQPNSGGS